MAIKKEGKAYEAIAEKLKEEGIDPTGLEVAALRRGPDRLVLLNGETIGEYSCKSKKLFLYKNI